MPEKRCLHQEFVNKPLFCQQAPAPYVSEMWRRLKIYIAIFDQNHRMSYFEHAEFDYQASFSINWTVSVWETLEDDIIFALRH